MNQEIVQPRATSGKFTLQLSATPRAARLARLLATEQLRSWGLPRDAAALVVAELAANAVVHGYVRGRDFHLGLTLTGDTLRIEVADTRRDRLPRVRASGADSASAADCESGRGLVLVEALAARWGVEEGPFPRKTVWAEVSVTGS
ncbi:ATP-binding protein [Streptomyces sp. AM 2-1-1]|uniref:ATP-binding protein n=1 Tax=Streptomyces sp. AM 2-1-1 TaxID=3028709 RepID=UPI0023B8A965|nr:ATP-binding protein [Streptomyces sp. AM 2-1-1]WEH41424.1 ATP-binding protein [Streptomyces sp. AM 2-1-1]